MMSQGTNVENLKAVFRDTGGSSEATVTGAALESFDSVSNNASVLVSVRVTASDQNGNDRPSRAYRMRVVVHQDDNGKMTTYDLKYPNGGN
jgi:Mce-associated membrane protein